jgi:hypothetical protein
MRADRHTHTDGRKDKQTDMTKFLICFFLYFLEQTLIIQIMKYEVQLLYVKYKFHARKPEFPTRKFSTSLLSRVAAYLRTMRGTKIRCP